MLISEYLKIYKPNQEMIVNLPKYNKVLGGLPVFEHENRQEMSLWELLEKIDVMNLNYPVNPSSSSVSFNARSEQIPFYFEENGKMYIKTPLGYIFFFCQKKPSAETLSELSIESQEQPERPKARGRKPKTNVDSEVVSNAEG